MIDWGKPIWVVHPDGSKTRATKVTGPDYDGDYCVSWGRAGDRHRYFRDDGSHWLEGSWRVTNEPPAEPTMQGVPLRDWFAGQALAAMPKLGDTDACVRGIAHDAYLLADAMMDERAKKGATE